MLSCFLNNIILPDGKNYIFLIVFSDDGEEVSLLYSRHEVSPIFFFYNDPVILLDTFVGLPSASVV